MRSAMVSLPWTLLDEAPIAEWLVTLTLHMGEDGSGESGQAYNILRRIQTLFDQTPPGREVEIEITEAGLEVLLEFLPVCELWTELLYAHAHIPADVKPPIKQPPVRKSRQYKFHR